MLVGVRISAFVSLDDKKSLQKSIIGFLQPGKTASSGSTQEMHQKLENEHLSNRSVQTRHFAGVPPAQKKQGEGGQTSEQQSFFQRAHAKRLQLQAAKSSTQEEGHREDTSVITPIDTDAHNSIESCAKAHKGTASDHSENCFIPLTAAHASTSGCGGSVSESLTCPVCFRQVETTDLNVFNRHIDQCLSNTCRKPNHSTDPDSESDLELEIECKEFAAVDKRIGECKIEEEKAKDSAYPQEVQHSLKNDSSSSADSKTVPQSLHDKGSILTCPVCQLTQDTDDLTIFNHHVDLCLNREVLHELRGQTSSPINSLSLTKNKAIGECMYSCLTVPCLLRTHSLILHCVPWGSRYIYISCMDLKSENVCLSADARFNPVSNV